MGTDFANWLIDCHRKYDKEFHFREPMSSPPDPACRHYKMANFGSGTNSRVFESHKTKVKLKAKKVYGTINFFEEKEDEFGLLVKFFSFQRWPKEVYGNTDPAKGLLVIANLDTGE
ncbi:hypothetical protein Esi_0348_0021 [Ectocarpus siliculosus]|uniref:Uncharacterized protein n=1 Tax=Ectocarpus siliculosus TaxID=2880 RepID=D7FYN5_ECTSI|nr:hypothetical protein Esi_0348_0021 [Ectocarpus siliculosus]|eukprot:CBJ32577.1 hypothetical protein Esi_0348_0021 [Ectocarpus siliculosus]